MSVRRYALDKTRVEMFEIAHGAYVDGRDHAAALRSAFARGAEAERKQWVDAHSAYVDPKTYAPHGEKCGVAILCNRVTALPLPEYRE